MTIDYLTEGVFRSVPFRRNRFRILIQGFYEADKLDMLILRVWGIQENREFYKYRCSININKIWESMKEWLRRLFSVIQRF